MARPPSCDPAPSPMHNELEDAGELEQRDSEHHQDEDERNPVRVLEELSGSALHDVTSSTHAQIE